MREINVGIKKNRWKKLDHGNLTRNNYRCGSGNGYGSGYGSGDGSGEKNSSWWVSLSRSWGGEYGSDNGTGDENGSGWGSGGEDEDGSRN